MTDAQKRAAAKKAASLVQKALGTQSDIKPGKGAGKVIDSGMGQKTSNILNYLEETPRNAVNDILRILASVEFSMVPGIMKEVIEKQAAAMLFEVGVKKRDFEIHKEYLDSFRAVARGERSGSF